MTRRAVAFTRSDRRRNQVTGALRGTMKIVLTLAIVGALGIAAAGQSRSSVWIQDYTGEEVLAAVAGGKTTLIYPSGATHADGPAIAVGKHIHMMGHVAERIAAELGNALVLPVNPYAVAQSQMTHRSAPSGAIVGGTVSLSDEVYGLVTKEVITSALLALRGSRGLSGTGFKTVLIMGDHGQGQETLKRVAGDLNEDWESKGVHVFYIDVAPSGKNLMRDYLTTRGVAAGRQTAIDDASEFMTVDPEKKWVRHDQIPAGDRKFVSAELGKILVDFKVNSALKQIRALAASKDSK
jgi:creatinine amidohydrolase/Fe(II)-dependent formamide hydrolase-like protein